MCLDLLVVVRPCLTGALVLLGHTYPQIRGGATCIRQNKTTGATGGDGPALVATTGNGARNFLIFNFVLVLNRVLFRSFDFANPISGAECFSLFRNVPSFAACKWNYRPSAIGILISSFSAGV